MGECSCWLTLRPHHHHRTRSRARSLAPSLQISWITFELAKLASYMFFFIKSMEAEVAMFES